LILFWRFLPSLLFFFAFRQYNWEGIFVRAVKVFKMSLTLVVELEAVTCNDNSSPTGRMDVKVDVDYENVSSLSSGISVTLA